MLGCFPQDCVAVERPCEWIMFLKMGGLEVYLVLVPANMPPFALVAKKKSLFDDRMGETDELTHIIKQDIASLNRQIAQLQEVSFQFSWPSNIFDRVFVSVCNEKIDYAKLCQKRKSKPAAFEIGCGLPAVEISHHVDRVQTSA